LRSLKNVAYVEIMPFHNLGEHKYAQLGVPYAFQDKLNLKGEDVEEYAAILRLQAIEVKVSDW